MLNQMIQNQELLAAAVGFLGVMASLLFNGWLSRAQFQRSIHHKRQSLRIAILEELGIIKENANTFQSRLRGWKRNMEEGEEYIYIAFFDQTDVYKSFLADLSLLRSEEIQRTLKAYYYFKQFHSKMQIFAELDGRTSSMAAIPVADADDLDSNASELKEYVSDAKSVLQAGHEKDSKTTESV